MPHERTKALINAVEFLRELRYATDTPASMRDQLVGILRHLPTARAIELEALRQSSERGQVAWLLPIESANGLPAADKP